MAQQPTYPATRTQRQTAARLGYDVRKGRAKTPAQDQLIVSAQTRRDRRGIAAD